MLTEKETLFNQLTKQSNITLFFIQRNCLCVIFSMFNLQEDMFQALFLSYSYMYFFLWKQYYPNNKLI
jgi:hypothetical protein